MLRNIFILAIRHLLKHRLHSLIHFCGMSVTLACCVLILLYLREERGYDGFHENGDRIYRVLKQIERGGPANGQDRLYGGTPGPLCRLFRESFPEVPATRWIEHEDVVVADRTPFKEKIVFADPDFFRLFTFPMLEGDPASALKDQSSAILTRTAAVKYFGRPDVLGRELAIQLEGEIHSFVVTGVVEKIPPNSSLQFNIIIPFDHVLSLSMGELIVDSWGGSDIHPLFFIELDPLISEDDLAASIRRLAAAHGPENQHGLVDFVLQPLKDLHFSHSIRGNRLPASNPLYGLILSSMAMLILLATSINYVNLSIAQATNRFKEIGLRKVLGSERHKLIVQFLVESGMTALVSAVLAAAFTELLLPSFNDLTGKSLIFLAGPDWSALSALFGLSLLVGLGAGLYPALVLSGLKPLDMLRKQLTVVGSHGFSRVLTVFQAAAAVFLLTCTLFMSCQFHLIQYKQLGFDKEHLVVLRTNSTEGSAIYNRFRQIVLGLPGIVSLSGANELPGFVTPSIWRIHHEDKQVLSKIMSVKADFLSTLGMRLVEGRDFMPRENAGNPTAVIVTRSFAEEMRVDQVVGEAVTLSWSGRPVRIIGIVDDIEYASLKYRSGPSLIVPYDGPKLRYIVVRVASGSVMETMGRLSIAWRHAASHLPFDYAFLDNHLDAQYRTEHHWGSLVRAASILAILITALGLFGLTAVNCAKRTKEIGIRKVLGADVSRIVLLLTSEYAWLLSAAFAAAWPFAFWVVNRWLSGFAHRISISAGMFMLSGGLTILVTIAAVVYQAYRAAMKDPVVTLRYE